MHNVKTILVAQLLISLMMAFLMTGIFSLLNLGVSLATLKIWIMQFITAWPMAFVLSLGVSKLAFSIANKLTNPS